MAHYLLRVTDSEDASHYSDIIEADSAKQAVEQKPEWHHAVVEVWTLRSGEPRVYEVKVETVQTITRHE